MTVNRTSVTLFEDRASRRAAKRTFVIFGAIRGGTTSATTIAAGLGLYIGDKYGDNLEDRDFYGDQDGIENAIKMRDAQHKVWGFKLPYVAEKLDFLTPRLRNPRFICVTRDLTANVIGIKKYRAQADASAVMQNTMIRTQVNLMTVQRLARPTLFLSYEKILQNTDDAIADVARFLKIEPGADTASEIKSRIEAGRYQDAGTV